jgi:hypothetical protein
MLEILLKFAIATISRPFAVWIKQWAGLISNTSPCVRKAHALSRSYVWGRECQEMYLQLKFFLVFLSMSNKLEFKVSILNAHVRLWLRQHKASWWKEKCRFHFVETDIHARCNYPLLFKWHPVSPILSCTKPHCVIPTHTELQLRSHQV